MEIERMIGEFTGNISFSRQWNNAYGHAGLVKTKSQMGNGCHRSEESNSEI